MDLSTTLSALRKKVAGFSLVMIIAGMFTTGIATAETTGNVFSDVPADSYYAACVNDLADQGVVQGTTVGTQKLYEPGRYMNRAEVTKTALFAAGIELQTATEKPFNDVMMGDWFVNHVFTASKLGIVSGYKNADGTPTGYFGPGDQVTRAQFAKIVVNAFAIESMTDGGPHFPDVASSAWYYTYVETAFNNGIVKGYPDGTFKPENPVNRAEAATMLCRAQVGLTPMGFTLDSAAAAANDKVELIFSMNVDEASAEMASNYMIEDSSGNPLEVKSATMVSGDTVHLMTATQEMGKTYTVMAKNLKSEAGDSIENGMEGVTFLGYGADVSGGKLNVMLSTTTPVAGSVPSGATGVVFTCWDFKGGDKAATVKSLHVHRVGPGSQTDFQNVYLYRGDMRLTTGRSINSETQLAEFNNINQSVGAGETMKLCVVADLVAGKTGGVHAFELMEADSVMTNSEEMVGSFPLRGADQLITSATVGTATLRKNGSLPELTIGQKDARISQFEIEASGSEDMTLKRIALYVRGSISVGDISNMKLYAEGDDTVLAETDSVGEKSLTTFVLDNGYKIGRGQRKIFYVTADLKGRNGDNIKSYLDETTDLLITGNTFGYGAKVVINSVGTGFDGGDTNSTEGDGVGDQYSFVKLKGGVFNVNWTGPVSGDVALGQNNARCLDLTIANNSDDDVQIKDWVVEINAINGDAAVDAKDLFNGTDLNFTNIKLARINEDGSVGGALLGPIELNSSGSDINQDITLSGDATIAKGSTVKASVVVNIANNVALDGNKIKCTLRNVATSDRVRDANGDQLGSNAVTPANDIAGSVMNVTKGGLTIGVASTPAATTYAFGTPNAPLVGLSFTAGQSLDIKISSLTVLGYGATSAGNAFVAGSVGANPLKNTVQTVELLDGSTVLDVANVETDGSAVFDIPSNLRPMIAKGATKNLVVRAVLIPNTANTGVVKFAVKSDGTNPIVTAIDQNGQTVPASSIVDSSSSSQNSTTAGSGRFMTISTSGTGTVASNNPASLVSSLVSGSALNQIELARWNFTAQNQTAVLQDFELRTVGNGASIDKLFLYTGSSCETPVATTTEGKSVTSLPSNETGTQGQIEFTNVSINVPTTGITVCAKATVNEVPSNGTDQPTSGTRVGVALYNVTEVVGGSFNVSDKFIGTFVNASDALDTADLAGTNANATLNRTGATALAIGDVVVVGDEMMLVTQASTDPEVVRGFAGTPISSHKIGDAVLRVSNIAKKTTAAFATEVKKGNIFVKADLGGDKGDYAYCLATADGGGVGNFVTLSQVDGPDADATFDEACAAAAASDTVFQLHGPFSVLRRAVPTLDNTTPNDSPTFGVAEQNVLKFKITAQAPAGTQLRFGNPNYVALTTTGGVTATLGTCRIYDLGTNTALTRTGDVTLANDGDNDAVLTGLADTTLLRVGQKLLVRTGAADTQVVTIVSIDSATQVTVSANVAAGDTILTSTDTLNVGGLETPLQFLATPELNIEGGNNLEVELRCTPNAAGASSSFQVKLTDFTYNDGGIGDNVTDATLIQKKLPFNGRSFKNPA